MEDKMFDHLRGSTDAKYTKSLKELFTLLIVDPLKKFEENFGNAPANSFILLFDALDEASLPGLRGRAPLSQKALQARDPVECRQRDIQPQQPAASG